jgi:hypothetical protein
MGAVSGMIENKSSKRVCYLISRNLASLKKDKKGDKIELGNS